MARPNYINPDPNMVDIFTLNLAGVVPIPPQSQTCDPVPAWGWAGVVDACPTSRRHWPCKSRDPVGARSAGFRTGSEQVWRGRVPPCVTVAEWRRAAAMWTRRLAARRHGFAVRRRRHQLKVSFASGHETLRTLQTARFALQGRKN